MKSTDSFFVQIHQIADFNYKTVIFRFRVLGRLESKYDETLMDYYVAFIAMCKRAAGLDLSEEEGKTDFFQPLQSFKTVDISYFCKTI